MSVRASLRIHASDVPESAGCFELRCSHRPDSMRFRPRQRRRSSPTAGHTTARRPISGARVSCCTSSCSAVRSRPAAGGPRPTASACARIAWSLASPQARAPRNLAMHVRARRIPLRATRGCGRSAALSKGARHCSTSPFPGLALVVALLSLWALKEPLLCLSQRLCRVWSLPCLWSGPSATSLPGTAGAWPE